MDNVQELYEIYSRNQETEDTLKEVDQELAEFIHSNVIQDERPMFFDVVNSFTKIKEKHYFKAGFKTAITLLLEKR